MDKFYTTFEAAKICQVSPGSIIRWIREGRLPALTTPGGHRRISAKNLEYFMSQFRMPLPDEWNAGPLKILLMTEPGLKKQSVCRMIGEFYPKAEVEEVQDYFMAGWKAARLRPDLLILDFHSTDLEIVKVCTFMKTSFEFQKIPLLALLPNKSLLNRKKIIFLGQRNCLKKPLDKNEFRMKLAELTQNGSEKRMTGS